MDTCMDEQGPSCCQSGSSAGSLRRNSQGRDVHGPTPATATQRDLVAQQSSLFCGAGIEEHKSMFGFQPNKQYNRKGKGSACRKPAMKKVKAISYWKKSSFCLANSQQIFKPTPQEKISLARIGLKSKCLVFEEDGSAQDVHDVIMKEYPVLESCGGYTLLRLADNSHNLIEIGEPLDGLITVEYLQDILNNAMLYIRPLQRDILYEDMKHFMPVKVLDDEPSQFCHNCNVLYALSDLRKHIVICKEASLVAKSRELNEASNDKPSCSPKSPTPEPFSPGIRRSLSRSGSPCISLSSDAEEWENDVAVQQYLQDSFTKETVENLSTDIEEAGNSMMEAKNSVISIEEAILRHRSVYLNNETFRITARRSHVLEDMIAALERGVERLEAGNFQVKFLGELGIDEGGPKREFFRLLLKAVATDNSLFDGSPNRRVLRHNAIAFQDKIYEQIGRVIALSILHGGPGPVFFATAVVDYLFGGISAVNPCIDDIPDDQLRIKIAELDASSNEDFNAILSSKELKDIWKTCGFSVKPIELVKFEDKKKIVNAMVLHFTIFASLGELEQMSQGLAFLKFSCLMKSHADLIKTAFYPSLNSISARYLQDEFKAMLSPKGSGKRTAEEATLITWFQYLENVEAEGEERSPNLKDVLVFLTGSDVVPPLGFDMSPSIEFTDEEKFPTVSSCSLTLTFSRSLKADFMEMMDMAVLGSEGFHRL